MVAERATPAVVAAGVDLPALARTGGAQRVEPIQLVGSAAVALEVLVLRAAPIERALPELPQVDGDVTKLPRLRVPLPWSIIRIQRQ